MSKELENRFFDFLDYRGINSATDEDDSIFTVHEVAEWFADCEPERTEKEVNMYAGFLVNKWWREGLSERLEDGYRPLKFDEEEESIEDVPVEDEFGRPDLEDDFVADLGRKAKDYRINDEENMDECNDKVIKEEDEEKEKSKPNVYRYYGEMKNLNKLAEEIIDEFGDVKKYGEFADKVREYVVSKYVDEKELGEYVKELALLGIDTYFTRTMWEIVEDMRENKEDVKGKEIEEESKMYDLTPDDGRQSFYGKAKVVVDDEGNETLYSYNTKIMTKKANGEMVRHYDDYSMTTGRHIKSFSGLDKKGFFKLELVEEKKESRCEGCHKKMRKECGDRKNVEKESNLRKAIRDRRNLREKRR